MITTDELREAACRLVGDEIMAERGKPPFGIGMVMRNHGPVNPNPESGTF